MWYGGGKRGRKHDVSWKKWGFREKRRVYRKMKGGESIMDVRAEA